MRLVMKISDRIHVLDQRPHAWPKAPPHEVRANPAVIAAYLGVHARQEAARAVG